MKIVIRKIAYCIIWILVSLVSSFPDILKWDWGFVYNSIDLMKAFLSPLVIWSIAYFVDYLYQVWNFNKEKDYEVRSWRIAVIICVIIELGAISCVIHYCGDHSDINPIIFVVFTLIFFVLKLGSLFAIKEKPQAKRQIVVKEIS